MARDGSGNYTIPNTFTAGTTIVSDDVDQNFSDVATALTGSIAKNGETTPTANLPMGTYKHTNVAAAAARTDYARAGETQATLAYTWCTVGGTADVITLTTSFGPAAYAAGQTVRFAAGANNTGAVTVNWNSLGAKDLKTLANAALAADDLVSGQIYTAVYDGTAFRLAGHVPAELLSAPSGSITSSGYTQNTSRLLGRTTASAGAIEEITVGSPLTFTGGALDIDTSGLVPTGAITSSGLTMATARLIGRTTASTGAPEEITVGTGLTLSGGTLAASSGTIGQVVRTTWGTQTTISNTTPLDNTIPQNTEGAERFTLAITPSDASSTLLIDVQLHYSVYASFLANTYVGIIAHLHRDTTADAAAVAYVGMEHGGTDIMAQAGILRILYSVSAGSTSATTFKVRSGKFDSGATSSVCVHNGEAFGGSAGSLFGGVLLSSMTITEILP